MLFSSRREVRKEVKEMSDKLEINEEIILGKLRKWVKVEMVNSFKCYEERNKIRNIKWILDSRISRWNECY